MKPVDQTRFTGLFGTEKSWGNCIQACLASVFEMPLESAPDVPYMNSPAHHNWLVSLGFVMHKTGLADCWDGHHLIVGVGPRTRTEADGKDYPVHHCCVGFNGRIVHDPHPSRAGLKIQNDYWWFIALEPAALPRLSGAIRKHRDQRGDDRCWLDDRELYSALPEGYSPPAEDAAVEIENCHRFLKCRRDPATVYISPQRRIEQLEAEISELRKAVA